MQCANSWVLVPVVKENNNEVDYTCSDRKSKQTTLLTNHVPDAITLCHI
jgi:hypothetical protein